jgi:hypothetical protein
VSRAERISDDGLERLRKQLSTGGRISQPVLQQWVKRYGEPARILIEQCGIELDD